MERKTNIINGQLKHSDLSASIVDIKLNTNQFNF